MPRLQELLALNRTWAEETRVREPDFFTRLQHQQSPEYLWIGCSDSRVPANQIVGLLPGDLFVHRNVANLVVQTDLNCLSVLQYAVEVLKVRHVIVCGHYGCGGVRAALDDARLGLIDNWLRNVQTVARQHDALLSGLSGHEERMNRLCELNVIEQVVNVCRTTIVRDAWRRGQPLAIHGWIYSLADGILRESGMSVTSEAELEAVYDDAVAAPALP
jgi:carbonic anhydrase